MRLEDAEDLWLACVMQAPTYADHSLVTEEHLGPRAKMILEAVRAVVEQGWPMVAPEQVQAHTHVELRTIARRMDAIDAPTTIAAAERELIDAWAAEQYRIALVDAADMVRKDGREAAQAHVAEAEARLQAHSSGIHWRTAGEAARALIARIRANLAADNSNLLGSGFAAIDKAVRHWHPKRVTTIGGWTNEGKSTLTLQLLTGIALQGMDLRSRTGSALISLEDEPEITSARQLAMLVDAIEAVVRMDNDDVTTADVQLFEQVAADTLDDLPMDIVYAAGWNVDRVCYAIQDAARRGARVVAVDYLQCFETSGERRVELANFARRMKAAAVAVGVHLIIVSQLARPEGRAPRKVRPSMYMFKESGDIENITENALLVWRPQKDKDLAVERAQAIVDKVKDGRPGTVELGFDTERHMFTLEPPDEAATGQREFGSGGYSDDG